MSCCVNGQIVDECDILYEPSRVQWLILILRMKGFWVPETECNMLIFRFISLAYCC